MTDTPDLHTLAAEALYAAPDEECGTWHGIVRVVLAAVLPAHRRQVLADFADDEADAITWKQDFGALSDAVNDLYQIHVPRGPHCHACDPDEGHNPDCTHQPRWCRTCWRNEDTRESWPCPTVRRLDAGMRRTERAAARQIAETQSLGVPPWRMERRVVSIGPAEVIGHGGRSTGAVAADGQDGDGHG